MSKGLRWSIWQLGAVALVSAAASLAQTGTVKPQARTFKVQPTVELAANAGDRSALFAARQRPQALQLRTALARLPRERVNLAALDRTRLPVLVNPRAELLDNLKIFATADHYTASTRRAGMVVEINGTRVPAAAPRNFRLPQQLRDVPLNPALQRQQTPQNTAPPQKQRAAAQSVHNRALLQNFSATLNTPPAAPPAQDMLRDVSVQRTSYGIDVSFMRFGSVYNVTIDCGAEASDPEAIGPSDGQPGAGSPASECTEEKALGLARELEVAGGGAQ